MKIMIEQTELVINEWTYIPPGTTDAIEEISSELSLEVMRKSAPTKKGLACRFTCR
jgi:sigma54-dependent transcription regulator